MGGEVTTCLQIVNRAVARNTANRLSSLTSDNAEILHVIATAQSQLRSAIVGGNRTFYQEQDTVTSSAASSKRVASLSAVTPPVYRMLRVELSDETEVTPVDLQDPDAELAPRYYPKGRTLVEVGSDWDEESASAVSLTIYYVAGVTAIDTTGALTQTVSIEDEWAWLLDNRLARYLATKDVGRDPQEAKDLDAEYAQGAADYLAWVDNYAGTQADRFLLPPPRSKA